MATTPRKQIGGVVKLNHPNFNEIGSRVRPPDAQISSKSDDFCRAIICKRGLCRHAVSVCLSIMFVNSVETNKHVLELFSPSVSHTTLVFQYQTSWQYSDGNSTNGGVECRWGRKKSRFWRWLMECEQQLRRWTMQFTTQLCRASVNLCLSQPAWTATTKRRDENRI